MSIFANYEKEWKGATPPNNKRYFKEGTYVVQLHVFVEGISKKDERKYIRATATILEVTHDLEDSNYVGERVSWVVKLNPLYSDEFWNSVKNFVSAVSGEDFDDCTLEMFQELCSGDGTAVAGLEVIAEANTKVSSKGKPYTKVIWRAVNA